MILKNKGTSVLLGYLLIGQYFKGRKGKGAIYVQSAGNGGDLGDSCTTDCFINRPEVIAIGAANQYGKKSGFSERCTALFAVTYSGSRYSGMGGVEGVVSNFRILASRVSDRIRGIR